jgi:hypothetical protein
LIVVAALFAGATGEWTLAYGAAALIVGALTLGARLALTPRAARVGSALAAAVGGAVAWVLPPEAGQALRPPWPSFALGGLLAGTVLLCRRDTGTRSALALLPGLVALTACGEAPLGRVYVVVAVVHVGLALLALGAGVRPFAELARLPRRAWATAAALLALSAALAVALACVLPPLSLWTEARVFHSLGGAEVGFSDRMWLGSLHGMLQSDEIVLRVEGARADYLRGAVYDHYEVGRWGPRRPPRPVPVVARDLAAAEAGRTRVTTVSGVRDRFFVPLGAALVATDPGATVDDFGVLRATGGAAREVSFEPSGGSDFAVAEPAAVDLDIPLGMRGMLDHIAAEWTAGATSPEAKALAIATRLRAEYTYALEFDHHRRRDPLLDFLLDDHRGHCEYFASAMTLLARAAGIPARVAIGYRVAEQNPVGGYWVVRERNAHAWSEVFLPGRGFVTIDATPGGAVAQNEPHRQPVLGALWDYAGAALGRILGGLGLVRFACATLALLVAALVARRLRRRRARKPDVPLQEAFAKPPRSLARLLDALARRGEVRPAWEPLERFADRLHPSLAGAADLLRRWAAHRYGGVGSEAALAREMDAFAERLRRRCP